MAGKYGSADITVTLEDAPGGTARTITSYILSMGGVKITSNMEVATALGVAWEAWKPTGLKKGDPITLTGNWDTTATTGPHVVFIAPDDGPNDDTREMVVVFGDSKTATIQTRLVSYAVNAQTGGLTKFEAVLQPTGDGATAAIVWS